MAKQTKRGRPKGAKPSSPSISRQRSKDFQAQIDVFRLLLDRLDFGAAIVTGDGTIQYWNSRFSEMVSRSPVHPAANFNLRSLISASSWPALQTALRQATTARSEGKLEVEIVSGTKRTIRVAFVPLLQNDSGHLIGIMATEVTKLVEATQALKDSETSLQAVSARLLRVQDEERRHMARDLHDTIGQELAVAVMRVEQIAKDLGAPETKLRTELAECSAWLRKIESETRTLSYTLHPPLLDQIGLVPALHWYIEGFAKRSGMKVQLDVKGKIPRLDIEPETALFRIVQESLTNVLRHSGSTEASVRIGVSNDALNVSVEDKGKGFKNRPSEEKAKSTFGVGIPGMRGRLSLVQGSLNIQSSGHGTTVSASVPLQAADGAAEELIFPLPLVTMAAGAPVRSTANGSVARILIADDHEIARRGIRDLFRDEEGLEICGEAQDGLEALSKVEELHPDLLILDLSMPKLGGFSVANLLRKSDPSVKILVYSTHSHQDVERLARSAGCRGCVHKANAGRDLVRAARTVLGGGVFYERAAGGNFPAAPA